MISPHCEDYPQWYRQVIKAADPSLPAQAAWWGFLGLVYGGKHATGFDRMFKDTGH